MTQDRSDFMSVIHGIMDAKNSDDTELMYFLSKNFHRGQVRKSEKDEDGNPLRYFEHCRRTAMIIIDSGIKDPIPIQAGLGHDMIEDSKERILISRLMDRLFDPLVGIYIRALTKSTKIGYIENLTKMSQLHPQILLVKASDRLDNLRSLPTDNPEFCEKQKKETREVYFPLFESQRARLGVGYSNILNEIAKLV